MAVSFTPRSAGKITRAVRQFEGVPRGTPPTASDSTVDDRATLWALTPEGGIPARSGLTLGCAICAMYTEAPDSFQSDSRSLVPILVPGTETPVGDWIYNSDTTAIGEGLYLPVGRSEGGAFRAQHNAVVGWQYEAWPDIGDDIETTATLFDLDGDIQMASTAGWTVDSSNDLFNCVIGGHYICYVQFDFRVQDADEVNPGAERQRSAGGWTNCGQGWRQITGLSAALNKVETMWYMAVLYDAQVGDQLRFYHSATLRSLGSTKPTIHYWQIVCHRIG